MDPLTCRFTRDWAGQCPKAATDGEYCEEHAAIACTVCGEQATHSCPHAGYFVCGEPLCNQHRDHPGAH